MSNDRTSYVTWLSLSYGLLNLLMQVGIGELLFPFVKALALDLPACLTPMIKEVCASGKKSFRDDPDFKDYRNYIISDGLSQRRPIKCKIPSSGSIQDKKLFVKANLSELLSIEHGSEEYILQSQHSWEKSTRVQVMPNIRRRVL
jgi:hypothetical protein